MSPILSEWTDESGYTFYFKHLRYILIDNDGPVPRIVIGCKPEHPGNIIKAFRLIGLGISQEEADRLCYQWAIYVHHFR